LSATQPSRWEWLLLPLSGHFTLDPRGLVLSRVAVTGRRWSLWPKRDNLAAKYILPRT
jgi:hypothetical protein